VEKHVPPNVHRNIRSHFALCSVSSYQNDDALKSTALNALYSIRSAPQATTEPTFQSAGYYNVTVAPQCFANAMLLAKAACAMATLRSLVQLEILAAVQLEILAAFPHCCAAERGPEEFAQTIQC
jgi:hypothetical protein